MEGVSRGTYYMALANNASNAAIAIDNYLLGRDTEGRHQTIKELTKVPYGISRVPDVISEMMMDRVTWPNRTWIGKTVDDTIVHTWLFARDLEILTELPETRQRELRDACLDLSRESLNEFNLYLKGAKMGLSA